MVTGTAQNNQVWGSARRNVKIFTRWELATTSKQVKTILKNELGIDVECIELSTNAEHYKCPCQPPWPEYVQVCRFLDRKKRS